MTERTEPPAPAALVPGSGPRPAGPLLRAVTRVVAIEPGELPAALLAFTYFFVLLASFAVLRPVRDAMAIASGLDKLPWLFTGTFVAMLLLVPLFGALTQRFPRNVFIPVVYRLFGAQTLVFFALLATRTAVVPAAAAFYIWVSVYNVFVVSVFWSFMADLFRPEQARRLFGFIAAGGTLGMVAGPLLTIWLARASGTAALLLVTAVLLECAAQCARALHAWSRRQPAGDGAALREREAPVAGSLLDGLLAVVRSRRLLGLALHVFLYSATSTVLYVEQQKLVAAAAKGTAAHAAIFAHLDLVTQILTLAIQLLLTGRILRWRRLGVAFALCTLPIVTGVCAASLVGTATLSLLVVMQAVRRASQYAIERPGRETLFASMGRDVKYRTKNFMDTVVFRGGDSLSAWGHAGLAAMGLGLSGFATTLVPLCALWTVLAAWIGRGSSGPGPGPVNVQGAQRARAA